MKHPRCELCERFVRAWFHRHAPVGHVLGWLCQGCERFFCAECAPPTGEGKHDETACLHKRPPPPSTSPDPNVLRT